MNGSAPVAPPSRPFSCTPWRDPGARPYLRLEGLRKSYGETAAVNDVSLDVYQGEFFALLGASGSGKTTLLRLLAGFEAPESGRIFIDGVDVTDVPPYARPVNMMFQSYALFPHMTVADNVAFGLRQERLPRAEIRDRVAAMLDLVQMRALAGRKPDQLSGGQRQRVALARALARQPKLVLLDEPLAALDRKLREETQFELVNIQDKVGITFVVVTHDQDEAMTMASRIAVMESGTIVQVGTPSEVYEYPAARSVAEFIGQINLFAGQVTENAPEAVRIRCEGLEADLVVRECAGFPPGALVWVAVRPEKLRLTRHPPTERDDVPAQTSVNCVQGIIQDIAYRGDQSGYSIALPSGLRLKVTEANPARLAAPTFTWEDRVWLSWPDSAGLVFAR